MITLKYSCFKDPYFQQALSKLTNYNGFPTKSCITIAKLKKSIDAESVIAQEVFLSLLKQYAELDEKGAFVPKDNVPDTFQIIPEKVIEWNARYKEFGEQTFVIHKAKIELDTLNLVKLSPQDFIVLEELIVDPTDEKAIKEVPSEAAATA